MDISSNSSSGFDKQIFDEDRVFVKRYLTMFISNWYWFAISLLVSLTLAYGINRYSEQIFTVSSTLLIKDDQNGGGLTYADNFMPGTSMFKNQQNLNNEIGILKSFKLNKRVIDSLPEFRIVYIGIGRRNIVERRFYKSCPLKVVTESIDYQPSNVKIYAKIISDSSVRLEIESKNRVTDTIKFGERFVGEGFDFRIELRDSITYKYNPDLSNKFYFYFTNAEGLAAGYSGGLSVSPISEDASLVNLSISGYVPEQEAEYLNKLMEIYINQGLEDKRRIADSTIKFINNQLNIISDSLRFAEEDLQNFRLQNKLINLGQEGALIQSKLEILDKEKTELNMQKQYYLYLDTYIRTKNESGAIISPSTMGVTEETVGRLVQELAELQLRKKELLMNLSKDLPAVSMTEENIANLKKSLSENIRSNLELLDNSETVEALAIPVSALFSRR